MKISRIDRALQPAVLAKTLFKLERSGRYEDALAKAESIWPDKTALPNVEGMSAYDAAHLILRCGSVFGFHGHVRHLLKAQEVSKDLLMNARTRFQDIYDSEKIAECDNYLALAYWRKGEYNEAETWIGESLGHDLPDSNNTRLFSRIIQCLINLASDRYAKNLEILTPLQKFFTECDDDGLKGDFHMHLGVAFRNLGQLDRGLRNYELSRYFFQLIDHKINLAMVENNIAYLHKSQGRMELAIEAIDSSVKLFRQAKDKTREGFALDTKARIHLQAGNHRQALAAVEKAIAILKRGENSGYLAESYVTRSVIQVYAGDTTEAVLSLVDAVTIARVSTDEKMAGKFVREFEEAFAARPLPDPVPEKPQVNANDGLKLILPPSLAHHTNYQGVWINNTHLESSGLRQGTLAVVVKEKVSRGDLAAVEEIETGEIRCGFFDSEFGLISLETGGADPVMFDEETVTVLGRIVGFCDPSTETDGKMMVEPLNPLFK